MSDDKRVELTDSIWCEIRFVQRTDGPPTEMQLSIFDRYGGGTHVGRIKHVNELIRGLIRARNLMVKTEKDTEQS